MRLSFYKSRLDKLFFCKSLFVFMPLVIFLLTFFIKQKSPFLLVPYFNDEVGWFIQIKSVIKYGRPLGYNGYLESHAKIGTFGPWGAPIIYIMSVWGKVFGWNYYSPMIMNCFLWCLANFLFIILTKPNLKSTFRLIALQTILVMNINYMFTAMSEVTRFSIVIFLAGLMYYILFAECKCCRLYDIIIFVICPICLCIFIMAYIMFAFCLPIYIFALLKKLNVSKKHFLMVFIFSLFIAFVFTIFCYYLNSLTAAPYISNTIMDNLKSKSILSITKKILKCAYRNFRECDFVWLVKNVSKDNGTVCSWIFFYYLFTITSLIRFVLLLVKKLNNSKVLGLSFVSLYPLILFPIAFWFLYTSSAWTYMRGLNVALCFSLYLLCLSDSGDLLNIRDVCFGHFFWYIYCLSFMVILPFLNITNENLNNRFGETQKNIFKKYENVFQQNLVIDADKNAWNNTIAFYGPCYDFYASIPVGGALNMMLADKKVSKCKYVLVPIDYNPNLDPCYLEIYADNLIRIYSKE